MSDRKCECWYPLIEIWPGCIAAIIQGYTHEANEDPLWPIKSVSPRVDQYNSECRMNDDCIKPPDMQSEYFIRSQESIYLGYPNVTIRLNLCPFLSGNEQEVGITYRMSRSMILNFEYACDFKNPWDFYNLFDACRIGNIWREATSHSIAMPNEFVQACAHLQEFLRRVISYGNHFRIPETQYIDASMREYPPI